MIKKFILISVAVVCAFSLIPTPKSQAQALCDERFYSDNNVRFYNPCESIDFCVTESGALTGKAPRALTGDSNSAKVWNYFTSRGLTPVAAAGVMGNIQQESGFSPGVEESGGGGGLGIIQWTGDRRTKLEAAASAANVDLTNNDAALLFELNYLWDGEYGSMTWQKQVNAELTVDGDTNIASFNNKFSSQLASSQQGNGSTMVFHALIERSNDVPTKADEYPGVGILEDRITNAEALLSQYGNGTSNSGCQASAGGLTWDQAVAVAKKIVDEWDSVYCGPGSIKAEFYCNWTSGYCTAGAAWLAVTTAPNPSLVPGIPNGGKVADTLVMLNSSVYTEVLPDGSNLQPFSVWSVANGGPGHTGTIVGVGTDGSIITLETNWSWGGTMPGSTNSFQYNPGHKVAVYEFPSFEAFKTSHQGYSYVSTATPKDEATALEMAKKMTEFMNN